MEKSRHEAVLITAGTKRLGLVFAETCLRMGYDVILHYRTSRDEAEKKLGTSQQNGCSVQYLQAELSLITCETLLTRAMELHPAIVGVVNNAAQFTTGNLSDIHHFRSILEINALVPVALSSAFGAWTTKGWIVNITDAHIRGAHSRYQNYRISKHFLEHCTQKLALTLAPGIRVNALAPGAMLPAPESSEKEFSSLAHQIPLGKTGSITALSHAFSYLVSNGDCTGQVLYVDAGRHLLG